jgi:hypothetical protein
MRVRDQPQRFRMNKVAFALSSQHVIEEIAWVGACSHGVSGSKSPMTGNGPVETRSDLTPAIAAELAAAGFDDAHVVYRCRQRSLERTVAINGLSVATGLRWMGWLCR